jgi:uncharacterized protein YraI
MWRVARERALPPNVSRKRFQNQNEEEEGVMKRTGILIAAAMLLLPSAALAAPGLVTTTVSLRAGPGDGFPVVDRIPGGSHVNIHGCLKGDAWCDVSWSDDRGWVSSDELQWLYRNRYVYLSDYYGDIDVPVVPFVLGTYWSSYYAGRPFFHRRAHFDRYWRSHEGVAMRTPDRIARARAAHGRAAVTEGRGRGAEARTTIENRNNRNHAAIRERGRGAEARTAVETRNRADVRGRGRSEVRGAEAARIRGAEHGRVAGVNRNFGQHAQPTARAEHRARFSAGAAAHGAPRIAQPNTRHGSPMNARAQMPAPHAAAPAMPHVGGGGGAAHAGAPGRGGGEGPGRHH